MAVSVARMNSTKMRQSNGWKGGLVEWQEGEITYISVVFSWLLDKAVNRAKELLSQGRRVFVGGTAVKYACSNGGSPFLSSISSVVLSGDYCGSVVSRHNPNACFTTRGCPNRCEFCAVPVVEGDFIEEPSWTPQPTLCDNNFTASSKRHFDRVIDSLKGLKSVDFNQGFSDLLLTQYQADRLAEFDMKCARMAWDNVSYESKFIQAGYLCWSVSKIPQMMLCTEYRLFTAWVVCLFLCGIRD